MARLQIYKWIKDPWRYSNSYSRDFNNSSPNNPEEPKTLVLAKEMLTRDVLVVDLEKHDNQIGIPVQLKPHHLNPEENRSSNNNDIFDSAIFFYEQQGEKPARRNYEGRKLIL